jgi:CheY-like chemotaxis protein
MTDEQRAALVEEFGSYRMLKLSRAESLAPAGGEFAEACMAAAGKNIPAVALPSDEKNREIERAEQIASVPADADAATLSGILAKALKRGRPWAAQRAAELIGRSEDASVLYIDSPNPAPLVEALEHPNPRVRFAALEAIMALAPSAPFAGSSLVPKTLAHFATGANERRAVVAMPNEVQGTTLAGRLRNLGFAAESTNRGAPAVTLAQQSADVELVLVDMDIDRANVRDVLYALRTHPATGQTPIGLLAAGSRMYDARRLADEHTRVLAYPRPQSDEALADLVAHLQELAAADALTPQERAAMAEKARQWLGEHAPRNTDGTDR